MPTADDVFLLLMVKDEKEGIARPIRSARALGVTTVLLVDTGSSDGTEAQALLLAAELEMRLVLRRLAWPDDFARARDACLAFGLVELPGKTALFLDADDEVSGALRLTGAPVHTVTMRMERDRWTMPRLVRMTAPLPRYHGVVHEVLRTDPKQGPLPDSGLVVTHHAGKSSFDRWTRDEALLREDFANTKSLRSLFYLAQTIECRARASGGENEVLLRTAACTYDDRAKEKLDEEGFVALVRAAGIFEQLQALEVRPDDPHVARMVLAMRLRAHDAFPDRPDPLTDIAWSMLRDQRWPSAYLFAKAAQGCTPRKDALFLRTTAQWNETYDILSRACLHVPGKLAEGLTLTRTAARHMAPGVAPFDWPRVNLALYRERLGIAEPFPEEHPDFVGGAPPA